MQNVVWHRPAEIHQDFLQGLLSCSINGTFIDVQVTRTVPYFELWRGCSVYERSDRPQDFLKNVFKF